METKEITLTKKFLSRLGKPVKIRVLENSNLTDRERQTIVMRYVDGKSVKEVSESMNMEIDAFNKLQRKSMNKLYQWLNYQANLNGLTVEYIVNNPL